MNKQFSIAIYIYMLLAALFWASAYVGIRIGLTSYTPDALALLRYLTASVAIIPLYCKYRIPKAQSSYSNIIKALLIGVIGIGIYNLTLNIGELTVMAGTASFIVSQIPVLLIIFAIIFLKERVNIIAWLGIIISTIGISLITLSHKSGVNFDWHIIYVLLATVAAAIYSILQKPLLSKIQPIELAACAIWGGTGAMLIFLPRLITEIPHASINATLAAIYMGIFPGVLSYTAWSMVLSRMPASRAAGYLYIVPVMTLVLGWLLLGEIPVFLSLFGGVAALIGAVILHCSVGNQEPKPMSDA